MGTDCQQQGDRRWPISIMLDESSIKYQPTHDIMHVCHSKHVPHPELHCELCLRYGAQQQAATVAERRHSGSVASAWGPQRASQPRFYLPP